LPIDRNKLIEETRLAYGPVLAGFRNGWSATAKKRFPELYIQRENIAMQPDGIILVNDRPLIPQHLLQHLHIGHLNRDKMKSLARLLCWWPSIDADIITFGKECNQCKQKPRSHPCWKPWPTPFTPMQRVHADFCGPFLGKYYALVVEDSYSKFPEVFLQQMRHQSLRNRRCANFFQEKV
jgi:hypothetical protein